MMEKMIDLTIFFGLTLVWVGGYYSESWYGLIWVFLGFLIGKWLFD
jgi:hypothetical protein